MLRIGRIKLESGWRDRLAWRLANAIIHTIATPGYLNRLQHCFALGVAALEQGMTMYTVTQRDDDK